jgi:hypothetical protein
LLSSSPKRGGSKLFQREVGVQYTIESRPLTNENKQPAMRLRIEAANPESAITEYVRRGHLELVSVTKPLTGRESIATVRDEGAVFLVRVYSD